MMASSFPAIDRPGPRSTRHQRLCTTLLLALALACLVAGALASQDATLTPETDSGVGKVESAVRDSNKEPEESSVQEVQDEVEKASAQGIPDALDASQEQSPSQASPQANPGHFQMTAIGTGPNQRQERSKPKPRPMRRSTLREPSACGIRAMRN